MSHPAVVPPTPSAIAELGFEVEIMADVMNIGVDRQL